MDRRTSLKWMLAASAAMPLMYRRSVGDEKHPPAAAGGGYGTDPDLRKVYRPGEVWPLVLTAEQRRTAAALCDVIIPADGLSPGAAAVGVVDFLDEWVSAPYPRQREDRPAVLQGLQWLGAESARRFQKAFFDITGPQQHAICDDICYEKNAREPFVVAARFFARYRDLTAGGFYSTPAGRQDIGYRGNVPLVKFEGAPPDVLRRLGIVPAAT